MKKITVYSKITILLLVLLLTNACKKEEVSDGATSSTCKISKVDYGGGQYDTYTFNSSGQATQADLYYNDGSAKIAHAFSTYTYDANGLVSVQKFGDGSGQEKYTYTNGALSAIEVFDSKNVSIYKITITTDANKRIIGMKDSDNFVSKITRDTNGNYMKTETYDNKNNLVYKDEVASYDGKKSFRSNFSGWVMDLTNPYVYYIMGGAYFNEPSGNLNDFKVYSAYDANGNYTGKLVLTNDFTYTKQFNSKGYITQAIVKDALNTANNSTRNYIYSDCQ